MKLDNQERLPSEETSELSYVELMARLGVTTHPGGWDATRELAKLCQVGKGQYVLDVGCGVGGTPVIFAKQYGCRVMGIDSSPAMVERSRQRTRSERVSDKVELRVADAQQLPFEGGLFDVVFTESALAFVPDRRKALKEFMRVTKPGGFIGLNELSWLQTPVPPEVTKWCLSAMGAQVETIDSWKELLASSGLQNVVASTHPLTAQSVVRDVLKLYGMKGLLAFLCHFVALFLSGPGRKGFRKILSMARDNPKDLYAYCGYGIYVGRKQQTERAGISSDILEP